MRILVVEDEPGIADFIHRGLRSEGYSATVVADGNSAELEALTGNYDLVLLDVLLPGKNGIEVLKTIRKEFQALPVLMLTARGEINHKVEGLDLGANDYIVKPFSFEELLARIRAHLRRPNQQESTRLEVGQITLDLPTRKVYRDGQEVRLTTREFELLAYLMRHPGQVLSRTQILSSVWGYNYDPGTNVIEVYIRYLRTKLAGPKGSVPIETVRSAGYRMVID